MVNNKTTLPDNYPKSSTISPHHSSEFKHRFISSITVEELNKEIIKLKEKYSTIKIDRASTELGINLLKTKVKLLEREEKTKSKSTERELKSIELSQTIKQFKEANKTMISRSRIDKEDYIKVKRKRIIISRQNSLVKKVLLQRNSVKEHKQNYSDMSQEKVVCERLITEERERLANDKRNHYLYLKRKKEESKMKIYNETLDKKKEIKKNLERLIHHEQVIKTNLNKDLIKYQNKGIKLVEKINQMSQLCPISQIILTNN